MNKKPKIIPIASGKGGVGKTLLAANLSIALAQMGHSTIAVDMALGGSNLYTCLGVPNRFSGIGDFLKSESLVFKDLAIPTSVPNLKFIPGEGCSPFMANITHEQRRIIAAEIKNLDAEYIIIDLGAGTSFSTLHFFGITRNGLLVTTFETPAIMNFIMFLRNFIFRAISGVARQDRETFEVIMRALKRTSGAHHLSVQSMLAEVVIRNPEMADRLRLVTESFRPRIVFNMGDHPGDLLILDKLKSTLRQGLSIEADYFGFLFHDEMIRKAAKNREVLILNYRNSRAAKGIIGIARRIERLWEEPSLEGRFDLMHHTKREFEAWTDNKQDGKVKRR